METSTNGHVSDRVHAMFAALGPDTATILDAELTAIRVGNRATNWILASQDHGEVTGGPTLWYDAETAKKMVRSVFAPGATGRDADEVAGAGGAYVEAVHPLVVRQLAATVAATARFVAGEVGMETLVDHLRQINDAAERSVSDVHSLRYGPETNQ